MGTAHGFSYRTDDLPAGSGPFIIENVQHQWWVVTRDFVWRLGGGEGRRHSDAVRLEVGPWRYVSIPIPSDLQLGQVNSYAPPEVRRSHYLSSERFPERAENESLTLEQLSQRDSPESLTTAPSVPESASPERE